MFSDNSRHISAYIRSADIFMISESADLFWGQNWRVKIIPEVFYSRDNSECNKNQEELAQEIQLTLIRTLG